MCPVRSVTYVSGRSQSLSSTQNQNLFHSVPILFQLNPSRLRVFLKTHRSGRFKIPHCSRTETKSLRDTLPADIHSSRTTSCPEIRFALVNACNGDVTGVTYFLLGLQ